MESEEKELILNSSNAGFFSSGWEWIFPFWHTNHSWTSHDDSGLIPPLIWVVIDYIGITSINWCGTKTKKDKIIGLLLHVKICIKLSAEHLHQAFKAPSWAKVWPSAHEWAYKSQSPVSGTGWLTEHFHNVFIHILQSCKNQQHDQGLRAFPSVLTGFWLFKTSNKRDFLEVWDEFSSFTHKSIYILIYLFLLFD